MRLSVIIKIHLIIHLFNEIRYCDACNEAICASIVSKCMLLKRCDCTLNVCSCCKECFSCLSHLFSECCSCVNMCPQPRSSSYSLDKKSSVEDLTEPVPALFKALTDKPDSKHRWKSFSSCKSKTHKISSHKEDTDVSKPNDDAHCRAAYITNCTSLNTCKMTCQSMGATSYRWFHNGCCECIRSTCISYGINESKCTNCPAKIPEPDFDTDDYDYNQDDNSYDEFLDRKSLFEMLH